MTIISIDTLIRQQQETKKAIARGWFFRDGTPVPANWPIIEDNGNGSGLCRSYYGKTPRVYRQERLDVLNAGKEQKRLAKAAVAKQEHADSLEWAKNNVEGFAFAYVRASLILGRKPTHAWLQKGYDNISRLINSKFNWDERNTQWLIEAVNRYSEISSKATERNDERAKLAEDPRNWLHSGKQELTGEIVSLKDKLTDFGWQTKIVLDLGNGRKVYGTLPKALYGCEKGDRVTFSADVKPSHEDKLFGFYSRPTKASKI